ncbi:MAG: MarR family transcriptional regulator [Novosphingobium sp.]|nr:MarR family transcriptional regulator [Novosphingobium sp.]
MPGAFDSRHPLVGLIDEVSRLQGRVKSVFAVARQGVGLGESEITVLNAVVEAERPPTVPQIGRSLGHPRQLIQRAANSLKAAGLIEMLENPDHKRAPLLAATTAGVALKRQADALADEAAEALVPAADILDAREATKALRALRRQLEAQLRGK